MSEHKSRVFSRDSKVAIIGSGSWGTALAKILTHNLDHIHWFFHEKKAMEEFKLRGHNSYLRAVEFDISMISFYSDINEIIEQCDIILFVTPAAFLKSLTDKITVDISEKYIVSAIKGIVPETNQIVGNFLHEHYNVDFNNFSVISGPCHAEEAARELLSYLTIAGADTKSARSFSQLLECSYIKTQISDDPIGTEYSAVLKNIISLACGICHGLRYGDNFQAVLMSNGIQEINRFVDTVNPLTRDIKSSAYLGDLLVTGYSQFSRNRTFGTMLGKGYSVRSAMLEMHMVAEGYYATKCIQEINKQYNVVMPIMEAVYNIIYAGISPHMEIRLLSEHLR